MTKLLLFHAPWCGPSKTLLDGIRPTGLALREIDIDDEPEEALRLGIKAVPTLVAVSEGEVRGMLVGPANWGRVEAWLKDLSQ